MKVLFVILDTLRRHLLRVDAPAGHAEWLGLWLIGDEGEIV